MHRQWLLQKLESYQPGDAAQKAVQERITTFVRENPTCFERTLSVGHITGSAWILDPSGQKALLTHHRKLGLWLQPGGHSDGDPNTLRVALREAREESGIDAIRALSEDIFDLDVHEIPAFKNEAAHFHYDIRFLVQAATSAFQISEESLDLKWLSEEEIRSLKTDESVLRMVRKWKA